VTLMEIARNGSTCTNDQLAGITTLTFGGTLIITNVGSSPLLAGDCFKLFDSTVYAGAVANLVLPAGYTWANRLQIDGTVMVLSSPFTSQPTVHVPQFSGTNLLLWGSNGTPYAPYKVLTTTNLI